MHCLFALERFGFSRLTSGPSVLPDITLMLVFYAMMEQALERVVGSVGEVVSKDPSK